MKKVNKALSKAMGIICVALGVVTLFAVIAGYKWQLLISIASFTLAMIFLENSVEE